MVEAHFADEVADSVCVGRRRKGDVDEAVMLFLLMKEGRRFTTELVEGVRAAIARECSKRHVPRFVFETPEIPVSCLYSLLSIILSLRSVY